MPKQLVPGVSVLGGEPVHLQLLRLAGAGLAEGLWTARLGLCLLGCLSSDWGGRGLAGDREPSGGGAPQVQEEEVLPGAAEGPGADRGRHH